MDKYICTYGQFSERVKGSKFLINFFGRQFNPPAGFIWTNIFCTLNKYILQFGQIHLYSLDKYVCTVDQFWERVKGSKFLINFFGRQFDPAAGFIWTNIFFTLNKYILHFGQIYLHSWAVLRESQREQILD